MQTIHIMGIILYTLWVQTVHNMCTKNIIILRLKREENFSLREKGGRASLGQKFFSYRISKNILSIGQEYYIYC